MSMQVLIGACPSFARFTFKGMSDHLREIPAGCIAVGAWHDDRPIGLALGWRGTEDIARLVSVAVAPPHRGLGHGAALVARWESEARRLGAAWALCRFSNALPARAAFERLLAEQAWSPPKEVEYRLAGRAGAMARQGGAWLGVSGRILNSRAISYMPLTLGPDDDAAIARLLAQPGAVLLRGPLGYAEPLVHEATIAIRRAGKLVGWIIAIPSGVEDPAAKGAKVVEYVESYLDAALWATGAAIGGYFHAFTAQAAAYGEDSIAIYRTHPGVPQMVAFTRRRFAPMAIRWETVLGSTKELIE